MTARPIRFLLGVVFAWAIARAVWLWPHAPDPHPATIPRWAPPLPATFVPNTVGRSPATAAAARGPRAPSPAAEPPRTLSAPPPELANLPAAPVEPRDEWRATSVMTSRPGQRRFSLTAWALIRPSGGASGLAPGGQLGASQAGLRAALPLRGRIDVAARLSAPIAARLGKEAAVALDWRGPAGLPVTLSLERRIGLDRGGRDAWAVGAFGGASDVPVAGRLTLDIYAQAGIVGARRRDRYADGAVHLVHRIGSSGFAGGGLWAAAQPGVARVDAGPLLGVRIGRARLSMEWRARIAGQALPASGPALSLGADF